MIVVFFVVGELCCFEGLCDLGDVWVVVDMGEWYWGCFGVVGFFVYDVVCGILL